MPFDTQTTSLIVCDSVSVGDTGKRSLHGVFARLYASDFPAVHPHMSVFIRVLTDKSPGQTLAVQLSLTTPSRIDMEMPAQDWSPGDGGWLEGVVNIQNLLLHEPGQHEFKVKIDGTQMGACPFTVVRIDPSQVILSQGSQDEH